jgi:AcrR family transcriptional regulator
MANRSRSSPEGKAVPLVGSPRTARGARTRQRIREAANRLFIEQGFQSTTVDAIVQAAGISKGTFYIHFERKEDLLLEYAAVRLKQIRDALPDLLADRSFEQALGQILDQVVRGKRWDRELTGLAISEMRAHADRLPIADPHRLLQPLVELAQARGEVRTDLPAEALARFVLRAIFGALGDWSRGLTAQSRDQALDCVVTLILDAIRRRDPASGS